jgi:PBP1b-binding outer membrane lipoprotein LpoB
MNGKTKRFKIILLMASLLVVGLIVLNGCKKSEPAPSAEPNEAAAASE